MKKSERIYIFICLIILFIGLVGLFSGCKSKTLYIPVESVKTEYKERLRVDSIYKYDSIFQDRFVKGDTVFFTKEKYKYLYRDKLRVDTISRDSIVQVPYQVKGDTVYINRLKWYQEACIWFTSLVLVALSLYLGIKYRGVIFSFFRKLIFKI